MKIKGLIEKITRRVRELGKLTPIALVTLFLPMVGSAALLSYLGLYSESISVWLTENQTSGLAIYVFGIIIFCGLALLPTNIIGGVGGWAFGFWLGAGALIIGVVGSAIISYLIHLRLVGSKLPDLAEKNPKADAIYHELIKDNWLKTTLITFLVRASVIMPFAFTNFLMASARVRLSSYVVGTFGGMLPRSSAMAFVGSGLSEFSFDRPTDSWILIIGGIASLVMVAVIGFFSRRALERLVTEKQRAKEAV